MTWNSHKNKKILYLSVIIISLIFNIFLLNHPINQNSYTHDQNNNKNEIFHDNDNLETQTLSSDNILSGIGSSWNVTHQSNRTDTDLEVSFSNGTYDNTQGIPLYGWEGNTLNASLYDIYDSRNWNNGTFNFGNDNGTYAKDEDDSKWIENSFQNWTFGSHDVETEWDEKVNYYTGAWRNYTNEMSGNYLDSSFENSSGHDCLELRMSAHYYASYIGYGYNTGDKCWWNSSFHIPRGQVIDSVLEFDVNPWHLLDRNSWELLFFINDIKIYSVGIYTLYQMGIKNWHSFSVPKDIWINSSNVFSGIANDSIITIKVQLEYTSESYAYEWQDEPYPSSGVFDNTTYQQLFFDNVQLITKAKAQPSDIKLKINSTEVKDNGWGKGIAGLKGNWQGDKVYTNFSSHDVGKLGGFNIDLKTNLNLYAKKDTPETVFEAKEGSDGVDFSISNDSLVNWQCYGYVEVPEGYHETIMRLEFPEDVNITNVYDPQFPTINILDQCNNNTKGLLIIPISNISSTPDGFWKLKAISPNYFTDLSIYNNVNDIWELNSTFLSGDYINIRANITKSLIIEDYIDQTQATLDIRFPNGTLWIGQRQFATLNANGFVNFSSFQIPHIAGSHYQAGEYEAIVTWNNSHSTYGLNETGIIYKKFTVVHDSVLEPDQGIYYIENVINDRIINVKISFKDIVDNAYIGDALVYAINKTQDKLDFSEIGLGFYMLEFDTSKVETGNNTLTIYANSSFFVNKKINITIDVIEETILLVDNDFFTDIPYNQNFTIRFNYTEKDSPEDEIGIDITKEFFTDWSGDYQVIQNIDGSYNFTCNTSDYLTNILYNFTFTVNAYKYELQQKEIYFLINELDSNLVLFVNNSIFEPNDIYSAEVGQKINITAIYKDTDEIPLRDAMIKVTGSNFEENLTEINDQYTVILNVSDLGQGIDILNVYAKKDNYKPYSIPFIVQITENKTEMQIYFNGDNKTFDPSIDLPIGTSLNITIKYTALSGNYIEDATVKLSGDYIDNLTENKALNQYSIIIDTSTLTVGVKIIRLTAEKNNFETQVEDLRIAIRKIKTKVSIEDGDDTIKIKPGESVTITIELKNLDFGGRIRGAEVTYDWKLGDGDFDETDDGLYEVDLDDVPEGTYTITISVSKSGGEYDFEDIEITLNVVSPQEETFLFQILLIIAIIAASALAGYLIAYHLVLKYPKPVRKVRKYRRTLRKKKEPSVDITSRKKSFKILFASELDKSSSVLKGKTSEEIASADKMVKESLKLSTDEIIKKSKKKSIEKTANKTPTKKSIKLPKEPSEKINKTSSDKSLSNHGDKTPKKLYKKKGHNLHKKSFKRGIHKRKFKLKRGRQFFRKLNVQRIKRIVLLNFILFALILGTIFSNQSNDKSPYVNDQEHFENLNPLINDIESPDLDSDNTFSGIGAAWNVTHYANRTDSSLSVSFSNGTYDDTHGVPLGSGWKGYKLNASITGLSDEKNWCNGTFNYGPDNPNPGNLTDADDSVYIENNFQNWTFGKDDKSPYTNAMAGNYFDSNDPNSDGRDSLELRITGDFISNYNYYDDGDECWWNSSINITRGQAIDSVLKFDVNPTHLIYYNNWFFTISINNVQVYSISIYVLKQYALSTGNAWNSFSIPQSVWTNTSNVFSGNLNDTLTIIKISLVALETRLHQPNFPESDFQQILFDNIQLITKAEAQPSDIGLKMNSTDVIDIGWGKGTVEMIGNWQNDKVYTNFSSDAIGKLGGYDVEFRTNLNLYAIKDSQQTFSQTDTSYPGTSFYVSNNSDVNWESYGYVAVPTGYRETEMRVKFPGDINIWWVSSPQQPLTNRILDCATPANDELIVYVSDISSPSNPNGFWKLKAVSPNYCYNLSIYNNVNGVWVLNSSFLSGDYINIRANITKSSIIEDYIDETQAILNIRFPNGTLWTAKRQFAKLNANGFVNFSSFQIPFIVGHDYQSGEYEAIITWNNSFSTYGLNETGIIYKRFFVVHDSVLEPDQGIDFIEDILDDRIINVKISFKDKVDNNAIENAHVYYRNFTNDIINFSEISPGFYSVEYDARKAKAGNNTLIIYANSTSYINQKINITIDVTKQTILTIDDDFITVPYNQNFSILFNYTELNSPEIGINTTDLSTDWDDEKSFTIISQGRYNLTCNTSNHEVNKLFTLILNVRAYRYESKSIPVRIYISELTSSLKLFVNNTEFAENDIYNTEVWQQINITVKYEDAFGNHINGANVSIIGIENLTEQPSLRQYSKNINATNLGQGIDTLTIFANKSQYNPQTIQFIVEITERQTKLQIFLNDINKTIDPTITLPISSLLKITINYTDTQGNHIENATVILLGEGLNISLIEDKDSGFYSITTNTNQLGLGNKIITIDASKNNYEPIIKNLRITVRKIRTKITTEDGDDKFTIRPGESIKLKILIKNRDFGGRVEDADVTYDWEFGDGDLKEKDDGEYELVFENIPEGSYTIEISVYKEGGEYEFDDFEITLTVRRPEGESLLFLILLIIAIIVAVSLASYLIAYQRVLKYPKPVRKVRKYRRTLKKKKAPSVDITGREKAIKILFASELDKSGSLLKGKTSEEIASTDKMVKKSLKLSSDKIIEKSEKKSIVKKVDKSPNDVKK